MCVCKQARTDPSASIGWCSAYSRTRLPNMSADPVEKGKAAASSTEVPENETTVSEVKSGKARATDEQPTNEEDEEDEYNEEEDEDFVRVLL